MIKNIKNDGFDKSKQAIEDKTNIKNEFELRIKTLLNTLKINQELSKRTGANNTKLLQEKDKMITTGFVIN